MAGRKKTHGKSLTRSVRFADKAQLEAVIRRARELGMTESTYLRVCALAGAGYGNETVFKTTDLVRDIESAVG